MNGLRERYVNPFTDFGFKKLFGEEPNKDLLAEVAKFTREELLSYEDSLKYYRDLKNSLDTAFEEGKLEGEMAKAAEVIRKGHAEGLSILTLAKLTGLTEEAVKQILNEL